MREQGEGGIRPEVVLPLLLTISILMMVFVKVLNNNDLKSRGSNLLIGFQRVTGTLFEQLKNTYGSLQRLHNLKQQHEALLNTLENYQSVGLELEELRQENEALREQINLSSRLRYEHIQAQVIAGDPSNLFATITLDKGSMDGIEVNMVVTAFQSNSFGLLGKVVHVDRKTCQVLPLVNPSNYIAARLLESRFEGLVSGRGGQSGELIMDYVPKSVGSLISVGDFVITSGMQSIYPAGIYIGRVKEVRSREYSTTLEIILTPMVHSKRIEFVFILSNKK